MLLEISVELKVVPFKEIQPSQPPELLFPITDITLAQPADVPSHLFTKVLPLPVQVPDGGQAPQSLGLKLIQPTFSLHA